jgi:hypothetical protein
MKYMWSNDRVIFLQELEERQIFSQLPVSCQRQIFTDFLFQEFLYKFRRFFSFRRSVVEIKLKNPLKDEQVIVGKNLKTMAKIAGAFTDVLKVKKSPDDSRRES